MGRQKEGKGQGNKGGVAPQVVPPRPGMAGTMQPPPGVGAPLIDSDTFLPPPAPNGFNPPPNTAVIPGVSPDDDFDTKTVKSGAVSKSAGPPPADLASTPVPTAPPMQTGAPDPTAAPDVADAMN